MDAKVGFKEVQNYAQLHNIDFKTAAQKLGLSAKDAEALEKLGGDPGAPVDGFTKKPFKSVTLKSGRKVNVYKGANGKNVYEYVAADGTKIKEDYFLKQEGLTGRHFAINGKGQLVTVKNAEETAKQEETGFFDKAFNKIKKDIKGYIKNFTDAWDKSDGVVETTGALIGATTKTVTDAVKNNASNAEKGVAELTGSETAGKLARYASGSGFLADAAEAVEKVGDWSSDKIRNIAKNYTGTERQLLESFADFVDDMNAADIALMFVGGAGAAKFAQYLPKILKLLTAGGIATAAMTSCSAGDENISQGVNVAVNVTQNSSLAEAINALKEGQEVTNRILQQILEREIKNGATAEEILKIAGDNQKILTKILESMAQGNELLTSIMNDVKNGNKAILNTMLSIKNSVDNLTETASKFPNLKNELNQIISLIQQGNANVATLKAAVQNIFMQLANNGDVQKSILAKLDEIEKSSKSDSEKVAAMLDLLKEIKSAIDGIAGDLKEHFKNDATVNGYLDKILAEAKKNNAKTDETNALLNKLYALVEKLGKDGDKLGKEILNYIAAVGFEMNRNFSAILDAINKGAKGSDGIRALLEKVLEKQDNNTKAIIEAMGNIKVDGGNIDLSSIKAMLDELLAQSKKNGNTLSSIDGKLDVIRITQQAILDKINLEGHKGDERYTETNALMKEILDKVGEQNGSYNDGELLKILNKLSELVNTKLDDILKAIKDHDVKVTVDVTGKVKCDCDCGKNHEGIIGDLNDILG